MQLAWSTTCEQARIAASPLLTAAEKLAATEARKVLRRVHAVDSAADKRERKRATAASARLMAKIAHANPLAVFQTILGQVCGVPLKWQVLTARPVLPMQPLQDRAFKPL